MRSRNLQKEEAIKSLALKIIAEDGLENLTIQKLAEAANISARTVYIKYKNKEDLLIKLFIDDVLGAYENAALEGFDPQTDLRSGVIKLWNNLFAFLKSNRPAFALILYGRSSPLLNKAFQERNMKEGSHFQPIRQFLQRQITIGNIRDLPFPVLRALLFSPLLELMIEYFDHQTRDIQIVTPAVIEQCCESVIMGIMIPSKQQH